MAPTKGVILTGRLIRGQGREVPGPGLTPLSTLRGPGEAMDLGSGNQDADGTTDWETQSLKGKSGGENMLFPLTQWEAYLFRVYGHTWAIIINSRSINIFTIEQKETLSIWMTIYPNYNIPKRTLGLFVTSLISRKLI